MSLLSVTEDRLPDRAALEAALAGLPRGAPIVVMIHGFRFSPADPAHDPHRHILSLEPEAACWKAVSWPRHLGLGGDRGLAIGFGWEARGLIWGAHRRAARAGLRLARLLRLLAEMAPDRPLHLFAHSLGARVALQGLARVEAGTVQRVILISAAVFRAEAARLARASGARTAEIVNVTGRENTLFDLLLRAALPHRGATLGRGGPDLPGWIDLPMARAPDLGHRLAPARVRVCHWSGYLRPGIWSLYRALILRPTETPLPWVRARLDSTEAKTSRKAMVLDFLAVPGIAARSADRPPLRRWFSKRTG